MTPFASEHNAPYIYFSTNPVVAAFYTVRPVQRPYSWYPYGFSSEQTPIYNEYYPNALADVYRGKTGFIYLCKSIPEIENPTNISCAAVCEEPVDVTSCIVLDDVFDFMRKCEAEGKLIVRRFEELNDGARQWAENMIVSEIESKGLKTVQCGYGDFLRERFPKAWERAR